jgi:sulfur carrier protein
VDSAGRNPIGGEGVATVKATVNGETHELPDGMTVADLLARVGAPASGIAVARNSSVVRRDEYGNQMIADGDTIEIIKAVAGG